jgi:hypothetical protein
MSFTISESTQIKRQAELNGAVKYITNPCPSGHEGSKYTSNGRCVQCHKVYLQLNPRRKKDE